MQAKQYRTNLRKLHRMIYRGQGESDQADALREEMFDLWRQMSPNERYDVNQLAHNLHVGYRIKDELKALAAEQKKAKAVIHLPQGYRYERSGHEHPRYLEYINRHRALTCTGFLCYFCVETDIHRRKARITALLNLYHKLRGSKHQHGVSKVAKPYYLRARQEYGAEFQISPRNLNKRVDAAVPAA